jgi:hypothetical protein
MAPQGHLVLAEGERNFKSLVDGLKNIANVAQANHEQDVENLEKDFMAKRERIFIENPKINVGSNKDAKDRHGFFQAVFSRPIDCPVFGFEGTSNLIISVALQTMKNVIEKGMSLTDEQVQLLCGGVDLADLLREPEENRETIDMVLRFIQDRALAGREPLISFEDIIPADIKNKTYQRLVTFVEQEAEQGRYSENLKNFIRNGRPAQGTSPNP